ncbi:fumarylacetoacetate hydrolase family protein [Pelagicoccus mobilis]|uniref:Fumarylacetoacetate hydrolase family protein n=1 Tax=Pelagicoccus mobilis TaxID=415221 RepID=A0A934RW58_9BACT|nr:fumarylacetoacetate hydrolase family protein [Pelagicoccus mobilis]MBK1878845.1 fumarylacetoacetate hydrolase family protein [Pelagicoccus mobilis]
MILSRHNISNADRWAIDGMLLPPETSLSSLLQMSRREMMSNLASIASAEAVNGEPLAPIDADQEVWASGVTYMSSRLAREAESETADVYEKVYDADRPELFFKSNGWRVVGPNGNIRVRSDSAWDVPEPELTLVINAHEEIVGFTVGNDVSSRSIEGENPLYLPQAKVYNQSCALGPAIKLVDSESLRDLPIHLQIHRSGSVVFEGETRTSQMKRNLEELVSYLFREMDFPNGALLMTGTGIIPTEEFTLQSGDLVRIQIDDMILENPVL